MAAPLLLLLAAGAVVLGGGGGKKKKAPQRVKGEPSRINPVLPPSFTADLTFVGDFRPTPGGYESFNSRWCMPAFAGGQCADLPMKLGFPSSWVSAEALQIELTQSPDPLDVRAWVDAYARTTGDKEKAIQGDPSVFTDTPCAHYEYVGQASHGKIPRVVLEQNPGGLSGTELENCAFAIGAPPELRVVLAEGVHHLVLTIPPGEGSFGLFRVVVEWRQMP